MYNYVLTKEDVKGLYRTVTGVETEEDVAEIPDKFDLDYNYPNPFNPSTTIRYKLPEASKVKLTIHNTLGQKVATIVNLNNQEAGFYNVEWSADNMSSGIYFYRLEAGNFIKIRKMTLLK